MTKKPQQLIQNGVFSTVTTLYKPISTPLLFPLQECITIPVMNRQALENFVLAGITAASSPIHPLPKLYHPYMQSLLTCQLYQSRQTYHLKQSWRIVCTQATGWSCKRTGTAYFPFKRNACLFTRGFIKCRGCLHSEGTFQLEILSCNLDNRSHLIWGHPHYNCSPTTGFNGYFYHVTHCN